MGWDKLASKSIQLNPNFRCWTPPIIYKYFPLTPMGVLVPGSAHAILSTGPPINMSGNYLAHMSAESPSNISPNPSEVISEVSEP